MIDATERILERLRKAAPKDLSIEEIASLTGAHRNTVGKYVYALEKQGKIEMTRQLGNAKLYSVRESKS